ncbi:hypothetical protein FD14_GL002734 [Secundilactobacillus similis DSM 23365 = JCM 2765]|uniref:Uncharacterized protein n=2 Tax=Secundilactobacillus similis TaxID=414682 RepID=A0A0R2EJY8_9LACO|nr:hypothetical protein FD14_GL002734 [Secundilactobacillus similis DSM 23365 = JCM 2765]
MKVVNEMTFLIGVLKTGLALFSILALIDVAGILLIWMLRRVIRHVTLANDYLTAIRSARAHQRFVNRQQQLTDE